MIIALIGNDLQAVHQTSKVASTCNFLGCSKENRNWLKNTGDRKSLPLSHLLGRLTPKRFTTQRLGWSSNAGRIFFACTVAFSIPISKLLSVEALWKGPRWWGGMYSTSRTVSYSFVVHTHIAHMCTMCTDQEFFWASTRREIHTHMHLISIWEADASDACVPRANRCATPGSIMGIGPCILTKVFCALFMGDARWVIGWAMVGRAEFAPLILERS